MKKQERLSSYGKAFGMLSMAATLLFLIGVFTISPDLYLDLLVLIPHAVVFNLFNRLAYVAIDYAYPHCPAVF